MQHDTGCILADHRSRRSCLRNARKCWPALEEQTIEIERCESSPHSTSFRVTSTAPGMMHGSEGASEDVAHSNTFKRSIDRSRLEGTSVALLGATLVIC